MTAKHFLTGELKFDEGLIFRKYPLADADKAFALYENPRQVKGKILLVNP
jgi:L-iditol 2-dehydrogenase